MSYAYIKSQIPWETGNHPITCPSCKKQARAKVGAFRRYSPAAFYKCRRVTTTCRHCHTSYSFDWRRM